MLASYFLQRAVYSAVFLNFVSPSFSFVTASPNCGRQPNATPWDQPAAACIRA